MAEMTLRFTWGGQETYDVFLCIEGVSLSPIYEMIAPGIRSCHTAQQIAQRGNQALKRWRPDLLHPRAELPGVGFQYPKPTEEEAGQ
jgi:hypothetical protein